MDKIDELINMILSDEKIAKSRSNDAVYRDEPIIKTASQMASYLPPKCREMRQLAKSGDCRYSETQLFYNQGKFMEDFEDDFDYHGEFIKYFPTYQAMNDLQLRGYFSWRTKLRCGAVAATSLSFVFVYIYELLNLIGASSPEDGFEKLRWFWSEYRKIDMRINHYMKLWLSDFVVYYNLDKSLLEEFDDTVCDNSISVLLHTDAHTEDEIFSALSAMSSYCPEKSKFFKAYPNDMKHIVCTVYEQLSEHYAKRCKRSLFSKLFGSLFTGTYPMFSSAVFYDRKKYENYEYVVNDTFKFKCKNGLWSCQKYYGCREKNQELGAIIKTIDRLMREKYDFTPPLKPVKATKNLISITEKEIDRYLEEKRRNAAPVINIDISKLGDIRRASLQTQDKLIIDEENEDEAEPEIAEKEAAAPANDTMLSDTEYALMQCLLYGGDYREIIKSSGVLLSVAIDSINEKLFDLLADTAVDFSSDEPQIIEDYEDELKGMIKK